MARKRFDTGSRKRFDTGEGNLDMIKNSVTAIKHHAEELTMELKKNPDIEAWVLAKVDRAAQNLSDVTHYLDGEMNKFADGGMMADGKYPFYYTIEYLQNSTKGKNDWRNWDDNDWIIYAIRYLVFNGKAEVEKIGEDEYILLYEDEDEWSMPISGYQLSQSARARLEEEEEADGGMMADGGNVTLWEIEDNKAKKLKTGTPRAIKSFYTKLKNERLKLPTRNSGIQEWDSDITEEEVLKYNSRNEGSATSQEYADGGMMADGGETELPISEIVDEEIRVYSNNIKDILSFVGEGVYDITVESFIPRMSSNYQNEISIYFNENSWGGISKEDWNKAAKILDKYVDKNGFESYDINPSHNHLNLYFSFNNYPMGDYENKKYADGGMMADGGEVNDVAEAIFNSNNKKGKIATSFGDKSLQGLIAMIENQQYTSEEIANSIFSYNSKKGKISTSRGDKSFGGLLAMIHHSREGKLKFYMADGGMMADGGGLKQLKKGGMDLMEKTDDELLTNDELLAEHIKEAKRNKVKITNLGWNQGKDYIVSKTTQRKDGSNILTSFINFNHAWDSY